MAEFRSLSGWVQEQHLHSESCAAYGEDYRAHPARLVVLKNFLQESLAAQLSRFLEVEAQFQAVYGLYSQGSSATGEEDWLKADTKERFFKFARIAAVPPEYRLSPNAFAFLRFRKALEDEVFTEYFGSLTGLPLHWSHNFASHALKAGDFLKVHDDNVKDRLLAVVFYLSPGWQSRFGGQLVVIDRHGQQTRIEAEYNSLVAFDVTAGSTHFIDEVRCAAGEKRRLTISGWYHRRS
jgi:Rps23 Pro-64 3,4-dihydroxylase Tpa1-like proline 4-hydroxylase